VVVTWNSARDIVTCLESLVSQTRPPAEIVVVDNASADDTAGLVAGRFPQVVLERRPTNEGFARGNNIGIALTRADWVLTLNPDARLNPDYLECLLAFAATRPRAGMLGGKLLRDEAGGRRIIDSTGIEIFRSRRVRDRDSGELDSGGRDQAEPVFGVCAAAALYRREMLLDILIDNEIFVESFFCYYEDADLAWRARRRGWEAWYVSQAIGWHRRGGSPVASAFSRRLTHRNRLWLIARNEPFRRLFPDFNAVLLHEFLMLLRLLAHPALIGAVLESARGLPAAIRARKALPDTSFEPLPWQPGTGFRKSDFAAVLKCC